MVWGSKLPRPSFIAGPCGGVRVTDCVLQGRRVRGFSLCFALLDGAAHPPWRFASEDVPMECALPKLCKVGPGPAVQHLHCCRCCCLGTWMSTTSSCRAPAPPLLPLLALLPNHPDAPPAANSPPDAASLPAAEPPPAAAATEAASSKCGRAVSRPTATPAVRPPAAGSPAAASARLPAHTAAMLEDPFAASVSAFSRTCGGRECGFVLPLALTGDLAS